MPVSQAYQGIADTVFSGLKGEHPAPPASALPTALIPDFGVFSSAADVVKHVVKAAFVPLSAAGENPANAGVTRLCGVSLCLVPDTATALPKQARYQLRYTRMCSKNYYTAC